MTIPLALPLTLTLLGKTLLAQRPTLAVKRDALREFSGEHSLVVAQVLSKGSDGPQIHELRPAAATRLGVSVRRSDGS